MIAYVIHFLRYNSKTSYKYLIILVEKAFFVHKWQVLVSIDTLLVFKSQI